MIDEFLQELKILKEKDMLLTRLTNMLSSYFVWEGHKGLSKTHKQSLKNLLDEYYELINKENNNEL